MTRTARRLLEQEIDLTLLRLVTENLVEEVMYTEYAQELDLHVAVPASQLRSIGIRV